MSALIFRLWKASHEKGFPQLQQLHLLSALHLSTVLVPTETFGGVEIGIFVNRINENERPACARHFKEEDFYEKAEGRIIKFVWGSPTKAHLEKAFERFNYPQMSDEDRKWRTDRWIAEEVYDAVRILFVSATLAIPGCINLIEEPAYVDENGELAGSFDSIVSFLDDSIGNMRDELSLHIQNLPVIPFFRWFYAQNGMRGRTASDTACARACCIYTHLFDHAIRNNQQEAVLWSASGIESLLADGSPGIAHQIASKIAALKILNLSLADIKTRIREAYHIRSRLIHGYAEVQSYFNDRIPTGDSYKKMESCKNIVIVIFILLVRYCYEHSKISIEFDYVARGTA